MSLTIIVSTTAIVRDQTSGLMEALVVGQIVSRSSKAFEWKSSNGSLRMEIFDRSILAFSTLLQTLRWWNVFILNRLIWEIANASLGSQKEILKRLKRFQWSPIQCGHTGLLYRRGSKIFKFYCLNWDSQIKNRDIANDLCIVQISYRYADLYTEA